MTLFLSILICLHVTPVAAQEGYDLEWWSVDGGGGTSIQGGGYTLGGTIGQPDAGQLGVDGYALGGGFWGGGALSGGPGGYDVYLPLVLRN